MNNCTFTENKAGDPGASVYNGLNAKLSMTNCVLWDADNLIDDEGSFKSSISFSGVQGGLPAGAVDGGGNIHLDPAFVRNPSDGGDGWGDNPDTPNDDESLNDDYGDLRLQPGSPCINAGDPDFAPPPGETDLDGHTRVLCERVDMGAYEFGIGDYDCDQAVTLADVAGMQNCFTGETDDSYLPACEPFDFDADSDIDLLDIARFQQIIAP